MPVVAETGPIGFRFAPVIDTVAADRLASIPEVRMGDVAAVSWGPGRIDLFWTADDGLWHRGFADGTWLEPEALGGSPAGPPAVTAWAVDRMEVFAIFPDGELWDRYWDGEAWHAWESLGGELDPAFAPAASSWGDERLDVFARGRDGTTWHRWWDGTRWVPWERVEGS